MKTSPVKITVFIALWLFSRKLVTLGAIKLLLILSSFDIKGEPYAWPITITEFSGTFLIRGIEQVLFIFFILPKVEYELDLINLKTEEIFLWLFRKK